MSLPAHRRVKRLLDLLLVILAAPLVILLLAAIAIAIKVHDPRNPVFYAQMRTGRHGRRFRMFKVATMVKDAEQMKESLQHLNVLPPPDFKIPDDPRVTPVGRFLRRTSLDELPQLLNVLTGDMSLVGPRPTSFDPSTWEPWQAERLDVAPGLTGLWQVTGRGEMPFDERARLDIAYARQPSLATDLGILAATVGSVLHGKGQ